jgi:phosphatidylserine/phosphatidylglycerophosphate/cardiolipin synthase-like enzyme
VSSDEQDRCGSTKTRRCVIEVGRNVLGVEPASRAGLIVDAGDYFRAFHRAACGARRYILLAGWRFDSRVRLLRGGDRASSAWPVELLPLLEKLCDERKSLRIFLLSWDFSLLYAHDREWMQSIRFNWMTNERILFRFDSAHPVGASHHEKLAIIDGRLAFAGGIDLGVGAWDDRRHLCDNDERVDPDGKATEPHHDLQACVAGGIVERLVGLYRRRWEAATGQALDLPAPAETNPEFPHEALPIRSSSVAISVTRGASATSSGSPVRQIRQLFLDAIESAQRLIYIENQYFSSKAVFYALKERMLENGRPRLQVVLVLPRSPHAVLEQLAIGRTQSRMLAALVELARSEGHGLGIYYPARGTGGESSTYIHSKLLIVDDRLMTVGSANTTNRSMGLDTELNLAWEAAASDATLSESIRDIRCSLLAEHVGGGVNGSEFHRHDGLIALLDRFASSESHDLRRHDLSERFSGHDSGPTDGEAGADGGPEAGARELAETSFERLAGSPDSLLGRGVRLIERRLR